MQLLMSVFPLNENVFAGHAMHCVSAAAAAVLRYLPAPQFVHVVAPGSELYVPAGQALQPTPGNTEHKVLNGITYRRSSFETVCISVSVRCMSQISSCARSQLLSWNCTQLMHIFFVRVLSISLILSCCVVPAYSPGSPSDLVLVPLFTPSMSTLSGTTPPFLLHMTTQSPVGSIVTSAVFETGDAMT
jgi:hypothetical protein